MRRLISISLLLLSAVALLVASPAAFAAKKKSQANLPEITRVQPMRVSVGGTLTITGKRFKSKRSANTVIFRAGNGRSAFAKPRRASTTKLVVVVPAAVAGLLTVKASKQRPTRLKLRVLAGKFSKFTSRRLSPVVTGAGDGKNPGKVCQDDSDHDNDLLSNGRELQIGTDPCLEDTDGDNMSDGWEYCSAKDLDVNSVPYPGERPYLNPLDPSDGAPGSPAGKFSAYDFDGDGLTSREEYRLWRISGSSTLAALLDGCAATPGQPSTLGYSDGTKISRASETPGVPAWRSSSYGHADPAPARPFPLTYDLRGDPGVWRDSERDADADGLSNRLESARGPSTNAWWQGYWAAVPAIEPYPDTYFGFYNQRPFADLDLADPDVDGDTLLDGEDDQDNDDVSNITELYETEYDLDGNGNPTINGRPGTPSIDFNGGDWAVNAMNPCAPNVASRTCEDYAPF